MYLIWFRNKLVVLETSFQIYTTPSVMPGFRIFCKSPDTTSGQHQRGLVVKIWLMSLVI